MSDDLDHTIATGLREVRDQLRAPDSLVAELQSQLEVSPESTPTTDATPAPRRLTERSGRILLGATALLAGLALVGITAFRIGVSAGANQYPSWDPPVLVTSEQTPGNPVLASDWTLYGHIFDTIQRASQSSAAPSRNTDIFTTTAEDSVGGTEQTAAGGDYSSTNVQVEGIDEGDIVKTDGEYLFVASGTSVSVVAALGADSHEVARIDTTGTRTSTETATGPVLDLLIADNVLIVLTHGYTLDANTLDRTQSGIWMEPANLKVSRYDISDPSAPRYSSTLTQAGTYATSRLSGDTLYLVSTYSVTTDAAIESEPRTYAPWTDDGSGVAPIAPDDVHILPVVSQPQYAVATAIEVTTGRLLDEQSILGGATTVYLSETNLYLAGTDWVSDTNTVGPADAPISTSWSQLHTTLTRISLADGLSVAAETTLEGSLLNQFALDEYDSHLRVVRSYTDAEYNTQVGLSILDAALNPVGQIASLVENESVQSVRFDGAVAYVVTFERVDPLFTIDVSDPTNPIVRSALKIPGFSSYLHPWGETQLLGIGSDADETGVTTGLKLSLFDISDPFAVTEVANTTRADTYSVVDSDHKSVFVDVERGLIGLATYDYSSSAQQYLVFALVDESFQLIATLNLPTSGLDAWSDASAGRGVRVGEQFYVVSPGGINAYQLTDFTQLVALRLRA